MRKILTVTLAMLALMAAAQQLPQFAYDDFEGWTYSGGTLTEDAISRGIYLYVTSQGHVLTLTSPVFPCNGIDSIDVLVRWRSYDPDIGLTAAIDDGSGQPLDSLTCYPASSAGSQKLTFAINVPDGVTSARLRFFSLEANVNNCGAVKSIELTAVASPGGTADGDVNSDGVTDINDVTLLISYLLGQPLTGFDTAAADVDHNGVIDISDATALIARLLNGR